jgi:hypothetical protein
MKDSAICDLSELGMKVLERLFFLKARFSQYRDVCVARDANTILHASEKIQSKDWRKGWLMECSFRERYHHEGGIVQRSWRDRA